VKFQTHRRGFLGGMALLCARGQQSHANGWRRMADLPVARSEMPATTHDGQIYIAGGFGAGNLAHRYDPATDRWERLGDLPVDTNHPGITTHLDTVIVAGGYSADVSSAYRGMWGYLVESDTWEQIGELPIAVGAFGFVSVADDLYVVGGATGRLGGDPSAGTWRWHADTATWEARSPMPHPREHLATVAIAGAIYTIGGRVHGRDDERLGGLAERYTLESDTWESLPSMPHPRSGLNGAAAGHLAVVAGGETSSGTFADTQCLDTDRLTWTALPDLPEPVHGVAIATVDEALFAIGGSTRAGGVKSTASVWRLEIGEYVKDSDY
jgi:N-acetylneuraminic acid mutarotase